MEAVWFFCCQPLQHTPCLLSSFHFFQSPQLPAGAWTLLSHVGEEQGRVGGSRGGRRRGWTGGGTAEAAGAAISSAFQLHLRPNGCGDGSGGHLSGAGDATGWTGKRLRLTFLFLSVPLTPPPSSSSPSVLPRVNFPVPLSVLSRISPGKGLPPS